MVDGIEVRQFLLGHGGTKRVETLPDAQETPMSIRSPSQEELGIGRLIEGPELAPDR